MTDDTTAEGNNSALQFSNDAGSSRSTWIAAAILIAIVLWMGSGFIVPSSENQGKTEAAAERAPVAVAIRASAARPVTLFFEAEGQAQPDRDTALRVESSGDVSDILVAKGDDVAQGAIIARLDTAQAEADIARAREEQDRAQRELDNARALFERGVATEDRVVQARAALANAEAQATAAREALKRTDVVAPFAGRIETLTLDEGEFVSAGSSVGRIVDNTPLTVSLQVPQQSLNLIRDGLTADVSFITGEKRTGRVTFVGTSASAETRTFLAEIEVPNADGAIPAGISAEIKMPIGEELAHFVSPSLVSLSPDGEPGIKTVENGAVAFYEISVARAEVDGLWVTGLPDEANLITIGQGFVRDGEDVQALPENAGKEPEAQTKGAGE